MARRPPGTTSKQPASRRDGEAFFYAAEVVRILQLEGIDYAQLRRLLELVREPSNQPTRGWARFRFEDLVALRVAVRLAGGPDALAAGRRLQIRELERACATLRSLGIAQPLLQVRLRRDGAEIVADLDGTSFRPATNQLRLTDTQASVAAYLATVVPLHPRSSRHIREDVQATKAALAQDSRRIRRMRGVGGALKW